MTPEQTLDWLAQQHFEQCREERPIQDWIRKMKAELPEQIPPSVYSNTHQPEQEPVAWRGFNWGHSADDWVYRDFDDPILDGYGNNVGQPLYTTPPQRTWIGLSDEEKQRLIDIMPYAPRPSHCMILINAIEATLKEKNT